ncbi:MAG TPA: flagellin [Fimbriimonadaceae bacterium]|nr:flagellin [Fimbriimonadaceae bacterium]HRJ97009.1 flagellin [Fimbriimonadaceae bacterium]
MSIFRVNTNVSAMNALRNLGNTNNTFAQSINKLSTGLRINAAADDPAGLIVSETFRAQISGIDSAMRNNQDAINYAKTAEGALEEVNRLLRDARALAVASANSATLTDEQKQANQAQLSSIATSISRISGQTQFGSKKLLDGSSGTYAASTSGTNVSSMSFTGVFNGNAVTVNSVVTLSNVVAATRASLTGTRTFAAGTTTMSNGGAFTINGITFSVTATDTLSDVLARINNASEQTGVVATWSAGAGVTLTSSQFGSLQKVDLIDSNAILRTAAGSQSSIGSDASADVTIDIDGAGTLATVTFDRGSGLTLRDRDGNVIKLTELGNATAAGGAWGQVNVGQSIFQIGANAGQTTSLSLANYSASNLGIGAVSGKTVANIDLLSQASATDAIKVIDKAIVDTSEARGRIGNFQRNVLESNNRSLGVARENLSATESSIRDVDIANEMTMYTKLQILQQSGLAVLAQANSGPQAVLALLRG